VSAGEKLERKRRSERKGRRAELFAALALMLKGYRIVNMRYRTPVGEIDIVARKRDLIAFVEVKARRDLARRGRGELPCATADRGGGRAVHQPAEGLGAAVLAA
jgi:hypothetical protein